MKINRRNPSNGENTSKKGDEDESISRVLPFLIKGLKSTKNNKEDIQAAEESLKIWREGQLKDYKVKIPSEKTKYLTPNTVANAIIECDGYIMKTAIKLGCSYSVLSRIIKENPKLKSLIKDSTEALLDVSENKLRDLILAGDKVAIIFHLKSKGRHRGWVDEGAFISEDEKPVQFTYETVIPAGYKLVPIDEQPRPDQTPQEAQNVAKE
jgi:hypothetical protein